MRNFRAPRRTLSQQNSIGTVSWAQHWQSTWHWHKEFLPDSKVSILRKYDNPHCSISRLDYRTVWLEAAWIKWESSSWVKTCHVELTSGRNICQQATSTETGPIWIPWMLEHSCPWYHATHPIFFTPMVNNFCVKYINDNDIKHLRLINLKGDKLVLAGRCWGTKKSARFYFKSILKPSHHSLSFCLDVLAVRTDLVGKRCGGKLGWSDLSIPCQKLRTKNRVTAEIFSASVLPAKFLPSC